MIGTNRPMRCPRVRDLLNNRFLSAWVLVGQDTKRGSKWYVNAIFDYFGMIIGHTDIMVSSIIGF
jgi:hypothetical protein